MDFQGGYQECQEPKKKDGKDGSEIMAKEQRLEIGARIRLYHHAPHNDVLHTSHGSLETV